MGRVFVNRSNKLWDRGYEEEGKSDMGAPEVRAGQLATAHCKTCDTGFDKTCFSWFQRRKLSGERPRKKGEAEDRRGRRI